MTDVLFPESIKLDGVVELLRCQNYKDGWALDKIFIRYEPAVWHLPSNLKSRVDAWELQHPGERSDPKIAVQCIRLGQDGSLSCNLQSTFWRDVRSLHEGLILDDDVLIRQKLNCYEMLLPNIGTVHVLATTSDGWIAAFRRSQLAHYYPGAWSVTYEEGLAPEDMIGNGVFHEAARRGLVEEVARDFQSLPLESFKVMSVVKEEPFGNPAIIVFADLPVLLSELPIGRPSDELQAQSLVPIPLDVSAISEILNRPTFPHASAQGMWHPTARYRLLMAVARHFGESAAANILAEIRAGRV